MAWVIRRASTDDAAGLATAGAILFCQAYEGAIDARDLAAYVAEAFTEETMRAELCDPGVVTLIAWDGGDVAGFAQLRKCDVPVDDSLPANVELSRIYLERRYHGAGLAQQLLSEAGAVARSLGANGVWLSVWEQNGRAIAFYEKHGFRRVGHQDFRMAGDLHCDTVMAVPAERLWHAL